VKFARQLVWQKQVLATVGNKRLKSSVPKLPVGQLGRPER
jgi:hypothetical protein